MLQEGLETYLNGGIMEFNTKTDLVRFYLSKYPTRSKRSITLFYFVLVRSLNWGKLGKWGEVRKFYAEIAIHLIKKF